MALGKNTDKVPVVAYLLRSQYDQLHRISADTDAPVAALIRRAVGEYLERRGKVGLSGSSGRARRKP